MASAAIPSCRPVNPSRSDVVALIATRSTSTPMISREAGADRLAMRADLGSFADDRGVDMGDHAAALAHELGRVGQKDRGPAPFH